MSLDPPLILWSLSRRSLRCRRSKPAERYAVNVLSAGQVDLARRFSRPHADRFEGVAYRLGWAGAPLIDGCVAWIECSHHALHRAGDHVVFIGEVARVRARRGQAASSSTSTGSRRRPRCAERKRSRRRAPSAAPRRGRLVRLERGVHAPEQRAGRAAAERLAVDA